MKIKISSIIILLTLVSEGLIGQINEVWIRQYDSGNDQYDYGEFIKRDPADNIIVGGHTISTLTDKDFLVIKYDTSGNIIWNTPVDGNFHLEDDPWQMIANPYGEIYLTGYSRIDTSYIEWAIFTVKLDSSGSVLWKNTFLPPGTFRAKGVDLTFDFDYNVIVTGSVEFYPSLLGSSITLKYDSAGNTQWYQIYNDSLNHISVSNAVSADQFSNSYVTGYNRISSGTQGDYDLFVLKYDSSGMLKWSSTYTSLALSYDEGTDIVADLSGNSYICGIINDSSNQHSDIGVFKFNSSGSMVHQFVYSDTLKPKCFSKQIKLQEDTILYVTGNNGNMFSGQEDAYIAQFDTALNLNWQRIFSPPVFGIDIPSNFDFDPDGNIYFCEGVFSPTPPFPQVYAYVYKYDSNGNLQWTKNYSAPLSYESASDIVVFDNDYFYITGGQQMSAGNYDCLTIRYGNGAVNVAELNNAEFNYSTYPNPAIDILTISSKENIIEYNILDVNAKELKTIKTNEKSTRLDIQFLRPGIYIIEGKNVKGIFRSKFIKL